MGLTLLGLMDFYHLYTRKRKNESIHLINAGILFLVISYNISVHGHDRKKVFQNKLLQIKQPFNHDMGELTKNGYNCRCILVGVIY